MKVRTVFQPHVELEVPDDEAQTLRLQGLLHAAPQEPETPVDAVPSADAASEPQDAVPVKPVPAKQQPAASVPESTPATEKG